MIKEAGFGGGCHWCTEAVFSSLQGIESVKQGWIASDGENTAFSEGVLVRYDDAIIPLRTLISIHLFTHASTSLHSMRDKYRSAVYTFNDEDRVSAQHSLHELQSDFEAPLVTSVLSFAAFKQSREELLNYYYNNSQKPFCELYINPKLKLIMERFTTVANYNKLQHLAQK